MSDVDELKRSAAAAAVERVENGMALGLGTGSTVAHFLDLLGRRIQDGELPDVVGVPTSVRTASAAHSRGIPVVSLEERPVLDLAVDGADEVDPELRLVKGMGGALLREKVVAQAARRLVIVVDEGKEVEKLGTRSPLPVEVIPFAWSVHADFLRDRGARVQLRAENGGEPYVTDNGNYVLDCRFADGIDDPEGLDRLLQRRAGIVENGLFLGLTDEVLVGAAHGTRGRRRAES